MKMLIRLLKLLTRTGYVIEHKQYVKIPDRSIIETYACPDIQTPTMIFNIEMTEKNTCYSDEHWFVTKKGRKIYTITDKQSAQHTIEYKAELAGFLLQGFSGNAKWIAREKSDKNLRCLSYDYFDHNSLIVPHNIQAQKYHIDFDEHRFKFVKDVTQNCSDLGLHILKQIYYKEFEEYLKKQTLKVNT